MDDAGPRHDRAWWRTILVHSALAAAVVLAGVVAPLRELLIDHEPRLAPRLVAAALAAKLATSLARGRGSARSLRRGERRLGRMLARWGWAPAVLVWLLPLWSHWSGRPPDYLAAWQLPLGQIPWSDGYSYFESAHQLLAHGRFGQFAEQKPLFPALLAAGLALAQGSLGAVLLWRNVLVGLCTYLAAREVGLRYGLWCALGTFGATLGLGRGVSVAVVTEPLGIAFGALATAVLVSAIARRSPRHLAAGLFLLAVALQVRPGMQFVLVALGLWMAWHFRPRPARALAWAAAAIVAGTLLTSVLGRLYGAGQSSFYARPAFFVYGLVRGTNEMQASKDFAARLHEFPNEGAFARFLYAQAWSEFRREPAIALRSLALGTSRTVEKNLKALAAAVNVTRLSATDHHRGDGTERAWPGHALLGLLCALSVVQAWRSRERAFWLAVAAGSLASGAFVGNDNPVHGAAAVHPLFALGACLGLATGPIPKRVRPGSAALAQERRTVHACLGTAAAVILLALAGPAWAWRAWPRPTRAMLVGMQPGRDMVIAREASPAVAVGPGGLTFRRYVGLLELGATDMEGLQPPAPFAVLSAWDFVGRRQRVVYAPIEVARAEGFLHLIVEQEQAAPNQQGVVRTGAWRVLGPWKNQ